MPRQMYPIAIVAMRMGISRERAVRMVQTRELDGELRNGRRWVAALPDESDAAPVVAPEGSSSIKAG
jgi:hypothetical protein